MSDGLINRERIVNYLMYEAPWSDAHGGAGDFLGMGMVYYALVYMLRARVAVCLGSGGGFVPRLMRQAQRDLGISDTARTILVDGNCPEAGWGAPQWLSPDVFFRQAFEDVELLIERTRDAALKYFLPQQIDIDYLHIDADHTFEACLEDFKTYRRFLHEGSIVTLHDTHLPGAGVQHVVEYIRALDDCELIDFSHVGAGTAMVRIGRGLGRTRGPRAASASAQLGDAVTAVHRSTSPLVNPGTMEWNYLASEAFRTRNILAASYVATCPTVIEIGNAKTPIHWFLTGDHQRVIVVDPLAREGELQSLNGRPCRISHIRARFQDLDWCIECPGAYGLVILGMELTGLSLEDYEVLFELVNQSRVTVIEFPPSWDPAREQFEIIRANTHMHERLWIKLDLTGNDMGDLTNSWPPRFDRDIHVLEPGHASESC